MDHCIHLCRRHRHWAGAARAAPQDRVGINASEDIKLMERLCAFQWDMQYPKHTPGAAARQPIGSRAARRAVACVGPTFPFLDATNPLEARPPWETGSCFWYDPWIWSAMRGRR